MTRVPEGGGNKFSVITGAEVTYMLVKGRGSGTVCEERGGTHMARMYGTHIPRSLWCGAHPRMRQNPAPDVGRRGCGCAPRAGVSRVGSWAPYFRKGTRGPARPQAGPEPQTWSPGLWRHSRWLCWWGLKRHNSCLGGSSSLENKLYIFCWFKPHKPDGAQFQAQAGPVPEGAGGCLTQRGLQVWF